MSKQRILGRKKKGKREYLNNHLTRKLMIAFESFFETQVEIPRIKHGKRQTLETLINEEASVFAKYFRKEKNKWKLRLASIDEMSLFR